MELWGVATTTSGGDEAGEDREGTGGLMMVKGLERRMERLEESIGRLLVSSSFPLLFILEVEMIHNENKDRQTKE